MPGAIIFVVVMVLVVPVGIMIGGAVWSALFGLVATDSVETVESPDAEEQ